MGFGPRRPGASAGRRPDPSPSRPDRSRGPAGRIASRGAPGGARDTAPAVVGIDVAEAHRDGAVRPAGARARLSDDPAGPAEPLARLAPPAPALGVVAAAGGAERPAVAALRAAGVPVAAVDPRRARDFARATGRTAKTDRIDAEAPAHLAEAVRPEPRPAAPAERLAPGA